MNFLLSFTSTVLLLLKLVALGHGESVILGNSKDKMDIGLALGRGYSMTSGTVGGACITSQHMTEATYDYDYVMREVKGSDNAGIELMDGFKDVVAFQWLTDRISNRRLNRNFIIASIHIDKYYSGLTEPTELSADARDVLARGQMIDFFQMCSPGYVNGVRRRAELVFALDFASTDNLVFDEFQAMLRGEKEEIGESSLNVAVRATGMTSLPDGHMPGNTLVALDPRDVGPVMEYGFRSMVNSSNGGTIVSMEVLPWSSNMAFLIASRADLDLTFDRCFDHIGLPVDCSSHRVLTVEQYYLTSALKRFNLFANAEHILNLERKFTSDLQQMSTLSRCLASIHKMNECDKKLLLLDKSGSDSNERITGQDLFDNLSLISAETNNTSVYQFKVESLNGFIQGYYGPCMDALSRNDAGLTSGTMYTTHFTELEECIDITCTMQNSYYDTTAGACLLRTTGNVDYMVEAYCDPVIMEPQPKRICRTRLDVGESLATGEYICNGDFLFGLDLEGNLVFKHNSQQDPLQTIAIDEIFPEPVLEFSNGQLLYRKGNYNGLSDDCNYLTPRDSTDSTAPYVVYEDVGENDCTFGTCYLHLDDHFRVVAVNGENTETVFGDYQISNVHEYYMPTLEMTYDEHEKVAESWGGHIVYITLSEERDFLLRYLNRASQSQFYIGLRRNEVEESGFRWSNNPQFPNDFYWGAMEPSDILTKDVVAMKLFGAPGAYPGQYYTTASSGVHNAVYKRLISDSSDSARSRTLMGFTQMRNMQAPNIQMNDMQMLDNQVPDTQVPDTRDTRSRDTEVRNTQKSDTRARNTKGRNTQKSDMETPGMQTRDMQEQDTQEQVMQEQDMQEQVMQEQVMQEQDMQEQDMQMPNKQEQEMQEEAIQMPDMQEEHIQMSDMQTQNTSKQAGLRGAGPKKKRNLDPAILNKLRRNTSLRGDTSPRRKMRGKNSLRGDTSGDKPSQ